MGKSVTVEIIKDFFFLQVFLSNVANEEAGIAQVANINQLPGTDSFTSPPKDAVTITSSF